MRREQRRERKITCKGEEKRRRGEEKQRVASRDEAREENGEERREQRDWQEKRWIRGKDWLEMDEAEKEEKGKEGTGRD